MFYLYINYADNKFIGTNKFVSYNFIFATNILCCNIKEYPHFYF